MAGRIGNLRISIFPKKSGKYTVHFLRRNGGQRSRRVKQGVTHRQVKRIFDVVADINLLKFDQYIKVDVFPYDDQGNFWYRLDKMKLPERSER